VERPDSRIRSGPANTNTRGADDLSVVRPSLRVDDKPDSVEDDHLSGAGVAARPLATYPERNGRAALFLLGLAPDGVYLAGLVTQAAGELLPHRFTIACALPP